jgi:hypothetical protein
MFSVHPLGLVAQPTWADGAPRVPSEYFFHDLDHARFKVREDLLRRGFAVPDAYRDGSTIDPRTGRHRSILPFVVGARIVGRRPRNGAAPPPVEGRRLLSRVRSLPDGVTARAADLLLFEMIHEKSLPLDGWSLARALETDAPIVKLRRKHTSGFFGAEAPPPDVLQALPAARDALLEICA